MEEQLGGTAKADSVRGQLVGSGGEGRRHSSNNEDDSGSAIEEGRLGGRGSGAPQAGRSRG